MSARARLDAATTHLDPPLALIDLDALDANAADLERRADGVPLRIASKSLRCRDAIARVLARPGWRGVMAYTLPEALWLVGHGHDDVLVAYPSVDRAALADLREDEEAAQAITLMVDHPAHLDAITAAETGGAEVGVCIDVDASWRPVRGVHLGVRRSPLHAPHQVAAFAQTVVRRRGVELRGLMAYEAQIAGVGDAPRHGRWRAPVIRAVRRASATELAHRRAEVVASVRAVADLAFVNGGGTGSVESTAADAAVTEVTAGSGLFGPGLFDGYRGFQPRPAALFALPVVRRPGPRIATLSGGGWIASGPPGADREPVPHLPHGLALTGTEGAGEVQTPVVGPGTDGLAIGDRVWLRHAKSGELAEHVAAFHLLAGDALVGRTLTYRGEGQAFG